MSPVSFLFHFRNQFCGIFRHRTVLGTYIGTHLHGDAVCLLDGFAVQDGGTETSCEGVACTYGIGNLHFRSGLEGMLAVSSEHMTAIGATGQYEHLQVVFLHHLLANLGIVQLLIAEHTGAG